MQAEVTSNLLVDKGIVAPNSSLCFTPYSFSSRIVSIALARG
jgi:hypothetical protein